MLHKLIVGSYHPFKKYRSGMFRNSIIVNNSVIKS